MHYLPRRFLYCAGFAVDDGTSSTAPDTLRIAAAQVANIGKADFGVKPDGVEGAGLNTVAADAAQSYIQ
jgi:hypothetical protein